MVAMNCQGKYLSKASSDLLHSVYKFFASSCITWETISVHGVIYKHTG